MTEAATTPLFAHLQADLRRLLRLHALPGLDGMRIFVTGGTGFIGAWLLHACHALNAGGAGIRVTLLSRDPRRFLAAQPQFAAQSWVEWVQGDVKDYAPPPGRFDALIHGATDTAPAAARDPGIVADLDRGTRRVLEHAAAAGARRVLLLSSGAVYGEQPADLPGLPEDHADGAHPLAAGDAYGQGKRLMEAHAGEFAARLGLAPVIARCFSFVGHGLPPHLALAQFVADALGRGCIRIEGDGRDVRSYLHAGDLAVWLLALLAHGQGGRAYNVGSPQALTLLEAATVVRDALAPGAPIEVLGRVAGRPRRRYVPDVRRITTELQVNCWTSLEQAVRHMAEARRLTPRA